MEKDNLDYLVKASFYDFEFEKGEIVKCRNVADVFERKFENSPCDAFIIMMNPGKCEPKVKTKQEPIFKVSDIPCPNSTNDMVEAKKDPAQKCLIELMKMVGYKKIRILNLTDNREPKSKESKIAISENKKEYEKLSVFSENRRKELDFLFTENKPVIIAWGISSSKKEIKEIENNYKRKAFRYLEEKKKKLFGILKGGKLNENFDFYYLKLRPNKWKPYLTPEYIREKLLDQINKEEYIET